MQDPYSYQDETYPQDEYYYEEPRRGMNGWVIVLIVILVLILLCCLCSCLGTVLLGPVMSSTFSTVIEMTPIP